MGDAVSSLLPSVDNQCTTSGGFSLQSRGDTEGAAPSHAWYSLWSLRPFCKDEDGPVYVEDLNYSLIVPTALFVLALILLVLRGRGGAAP